MFSLAILLAIEFFLSANTDCNIEQLKIYKIELQIYIHSVTISNSSLARYT
jgi:hypothetical protein